MVCMLYILGALGVLGIIVILGALGVLGIIVIFVGVGFKYGYLEAEADFKRISNE